MKAIIVVPIQRQGNYSKIAVTPAVIAPAVIALDTDPKSLLF